MFFYLSYYLIMLYYGVQELPYAAERNASKVQAVLYIKQKKYTQAIQQYESLIEKSVFIESSIRYNLGLLYEQQRLYTKAKTQFHSLLRSHNEDLSSGAYLHLGYIYTIEKDTAEALLYFRKSLQSNQNNDLARYNYELLRKKFNPSSQKDTQQEQRQDQTVIPSDQKQQSLTKPKTDSLSEMRALQILDAMRNQEIQYIQQRKRKIAGR